MIYLIMYYMVNDSVVNIFTSFRKIPFVVKIKKIDKKISLLFTILITYLIMILNK